MSGSEIQLLAKMIQMSSMQRIQGATRRNKPADTSKETKRIEEKERKK